MCLTGRGDLGAVHTFCQCQERTKGTIFHPPTPSVQPEWKMVMGNVIVSATFTFSLHSLEINEI